MARPGPKLSKNPGKTAKYYRTHPEARRHRQNKQKEINDTDAKRSYRRNLMKIRRERGTGPQTDLSHKNGRIVEESRKTNRGRGGAKRR